MRPHFAVCAVIGLACRARGSSDQRPPPTNSTPPQASASPDSTSIRPAQATDLLRVLYERLTVSEDRTAVRSRLSEPQEATAETRPNIHDSTATDTIVQWRYDRLRFVFLVVGGHDFLVEARSTTDNPAISSLVGQVGTLEAAEATLGEPRWTNIVADTLIWGYHVPESDIGVSENGIHLYFLRGRLFAVSAVPYVD
jgi:hypothetical protein